MKTIEKQKRSKKFYTNFEYDCGCKEKKCPDHTEIPKCEKCSEPASMIAVRSLCINHIPPTPSI